jgi:hypothetical protein
MNIYFVQIFKKKERKKEKERKKLKGRRFDGYKSKLIPSQRSAWDPSGTGRIHSFE